ncbi:unnamed protein product [Parnassius apollo]|uniref:(apollo) hypothetical protein n=1 Tax=Parnassius apollo TaxID=110799 RepID=A0A8S3WI46_PARAO|nr:unnamed protein product [Parnassius apollo]
MCNSQVQIKLQQSIVEEGRNGLGCQFPEIDPFSEEVMKFSKEIPEVKCEGFDWVECYKSKCYVVKEILSKMRDVVCSYKDIIYIDDHNYKIGDPVKVYGDGSYVLNRSDHVKVSCSGKNVDGYNIVGDATPAAIVPLLSGKTELEMPEARISYAKDMFIDPELFMFRILKKYGYHTAYFEDMPWIGTFQYRYNGFKSQPADHYLRAFFLEESKYGAKWWNGINKRHCVGAVPQYGLLLNLSKQFTELEEKHFCFTFIADITHEDFNMISTSDDGVVAFLRHLKESGKLRNHLVIVMGDHGSRYSALRETYQGKIEERLPLMAIILPEMLKEERPQAVTALRNNAGLLTTPFDVHTTVVDAMGLKELANKYTVPGSDIPRGMSLLEPIPKSRTCGQAAVLSHWCVCSKWYNVSASDPMYTKTAKALADFINNVTEEVRSLCIERKLTSIEWVMKQSSNDDILNFRYSSDGDGLHHKYVTAEVKVIH